MMKNVTRVIDIEDEKIRKTMIYGAKLEGHEEGIEQGIKQMIKSMYTNDLKFEYIAKIANLSIKEVKKY